MNIFLRENKFYNSILNIGSKISLITILLSCSIQSQTRKVYEDVCNALDFKEFHLNDQKVKATDQLTSIIQIFAMSGYFNSENLHKSLKKIELEEKSVEMIEYMGQIVEEYGISKKNFNDIDFKKFSEDIFPTKILTVSDICDIILYMAQTGFARSDKKERYELTENKYNEYNRNIYVECAKKLGLFEKISPQSKEYDEVWILGASMSRMFIRSLNYLEESKNISILGKKRILAGDRKLYLEIDNIEEGTLSIIYDMIEKINLDQSYISTISNTKDLMIKLAADNKIPLGEPKFVKCETTNTPKGYLTNKTYPNYKNPETDFLTETDIANYLITALLKDFSVIDTKSVQNTRPTTETTILEAAKSLLSQTKKNKYKVLLVSNQPYVERQKLTAERAIATGQINCSIEFDSIGAPCDSSVKIDVIKSELGALILEKYMKGVRSGKIKSKRDIKDLQYSTRDNT